MSISIYQVKNVASDAKWCSEDGDMFVRSTGNMSYELNLWSGEGIKFDVVDGPKGLLNVGDFVICENDKYRIPTAMEMLEIRKKIGA